MRRRCRVVAGGRSKIFQSERSAYNYIYDELQGKEIRVYVATRDGTWELYEQISRDEEW